MTLRAFCVLRSGGDFRHSHVAALGRMLDARLPSVGLVCLSDLSEPTAWRDRPDRSALPMRHAWPGAWSKLELCRPDIRGPMLYLDLDTVLLRDLSPLAADTSRSIVLRDFFRGSVRDPGAVQSSFMLLTEEDRALVWEEWQRDVDHHFATSRSWDQGVFELVLRDRADRWQDTHPGALVGWKTDLHHGEAEPDGARVVVFHGYPRPWDCGAPWAEERFAP